jgi:hypothetical protein
VWSVAGQGTEVKVKSFDALSSGKFTARVEFLIALENPVLSPTLCKILILKLLKVRHLMAA